MRRKAWKPKMNETYYRIDSKMLGVAHWVWNEARGDKERWRIGNCFKTRNQAEDAYQKIIKLLKDSMVNSTMFPLVSRPTVALS